MRSLLVAPADSERKLARAAASGADVVVVDLEGPATPAARERAAAFVAAGRTAGAPAFVRINGLDTGLAEADLDAVVPARPAGIVLPRAAGGADVMRLSAMLAAREALAGIPDGALAIIAVATETPASLFALGTFARASARLSALAWGAENLSVALGAEATRDPRGRLTDPYRLARSLCLAGAAAAGIAALDSAFPNFRDRAGLEAEAIAARRDGFAGKLAIHPDQVAVINAVFTPAPARPAAPSSM